MRFRLVSGDCFGDFPAGGIQAFPVTGSNPLVRFKIFVMFKKVLDLVQQHFVQVQVGFDIAVDTGDLGHGDREHLGILSGLMLLELLATERKPVNKLLAQLEKDFGPHRYARIDTHFPLEKRAALMEHCKTQPPARLLGSPLADVKSHDGVKFIAEDGNWLMLRGSGTEPILRIYAEARSDADAQKLLKLGVKLTRAV